MLFVKDDNATKYKVSISKKTSLKLLQLCEKTNRIPLIMHNHIYEPSCGLVSFSENDLIFMERFTFVSNKIIKKNPLFLVTDGRSYELCLYNNEKWIVNQRLICLEK